MKTYGIIVGMAVSLAMLVSIAWRLVDLLQTEASPASTARTAPASVATESPGAIHVSTASVVRAAPVSVRAASGSAFRIAPVDISSTPASSVAVEPPASNELAEPYQTTPEQAAYEHELQEENLARVEAYDVFNDELGRFYRYELDLNDDDLVQLKAINDSFFSKINGMVVPNSGDGEAYAHYRTMNVDYRRQARSFLGDTRFQKIVDFQKAFTISAGDRFGVHGVEFDHF